MLQRIQRLLERGVVHAATGVAQVTAGGGRADILGELLGQRGEILALGQASLDLVDLRLGLLVADLVVHLDQDVCGIALLGRLAISFWYSASRSSCFTLTWSKKEDFFSSTYSTTTCSGVMNSLLWPS